MIWFVVTRPHTYTVKSLVEGSFGAKVPPCGVLVYSELFASYELKAGTYIFCDIERLSESELVLAAAIYRRLSAAGCRVLNDPARVKFRYALLRSLNEAGINSFDAYRADGHPRPKRFPVFIREEAEHKPAVTQLLRDQDALDAALNHLPSQARPLRGLIVIEYCAEPVAPGIFRRYGTYRIGEGIQLEQVVTDDSWNVKTGKPGLATEEMYQKDDQAFRENRFCDELRDVFRIAEIDYGRADFGLVKGRPQVYEINTNPSLGRLSPHPSATRMASLTFSRQRLAEFFEAIDTPDRGEILTLDSSTPPSAGILGSSSWRYTSSLRKFASVLHRIRDRARFV
jgi:hypothetical protein